jgi:CDP-glucose 4,6-dehydratase
VGFEDRAVEDLAVSEAMAATGFWDSKRVFVTGATGLVGAWLVKYLVEHGARVVAYVRDRDPQSELFRGGLDGRIAIVNGALESYRDIERGLVEHEIDTVFHLAAQTIVGTARRSPLATFEANVRGTYNLLEACRVQAHTVRRVVVASSDKAYGSADQLPYDETMPAAGRFPYDVSKSCADLIAQSYFHTYELPVVVARCGNIYGGGDLNWSRIVPGTIHSLHRCEAPVIRSDGNYTRDYVYVKDAVRAYVAMAEALHRTCVAGEAFNFGPARPYRVREIVDKLRCLMNCEELEPVVLSQAHGEIRDQFLDSAKAERVLGWKPQFTLEHGLEESIAWYRAYFARFAS